MAVVSQDLSEHKEAMDLSVTMLPVLSCLILWSRISWLKSISSFIFDLLGDVESSHVLVLPASSAFVAYEAMTSMMTPTTPRNWLVKGRGKHTVCITRELGISREGY